jgi:hypothetical protein
MKPSELFGVVIRTIGLLLLGYGLLQLLWALINLVGGGPGNVIVMLLVRIPSVIFGIWFLRGAETLVAFAYPPGPPEAAGETKLEREVLEAMQLLTSGKTEEAKAIVDRILH